MVNVSVACIYYVSAIAVCCCRVKNWSSVCQAVWLSACPFLDQLIDNQKIYKLQTYFVDDSFASSHIFWLTLLFLQFNCNGIQKKVLIYVSLQKSTRRVTWYVWCYETQETYGYTTVHIVHVKRGRKKDYILLILQLTSKRAHVQLISSAWFQW